MTTGHLIADAALPREGGLNRPVTEVAVGVLMRSDGGFLLTSRPRGKAYEGYWEFPGGKLESGESVLQALTRELHEELGIVVDSAKLWREETGDYPHALVRLHFCKVLHWRGDLQMRENQQFAWQHLPIAVTPVLPGTFPVLAWLAEEVAYTGATCLAQNTLEV